jgi:hypothetical protein
MIGGLMLGQYETGGLSTYAPAVNLRVNVGGTEVGVANGVTVSQSMSGQATASFMTRQQRPVPFSVCQFGLGTLAPEGLVFNGEVQDTDQALDETSVRWDAKGIDSSQQFNRHLVFAQFTNVDAGVAFKTLIAAFAPDFTSNNVQTGIGNITLAWAGETMDTVGAAIAQAIGGYCYRDLNDDVHLFITEVPALTPDPLDANNKTMLVGTLQFDANVSQTRNRAIGVGAGTTLLSAVNVGETMIAVQDATIFDNAPNTVLIGGSQRVNYTSKTVAAPTSAPVPAAVVGTGLGSGTYQYAYTDVTPSGESLPSPLGNVTTGSTGYVTPPASAPTITNEPGAAFFFYYCNIGDSITAAITYVNARGETTIGPLSASVITVALTASPTNAAPFNFTALAVSGDGTVTAKNLYVYRNGTAIGYMQVTAAGTSITAIPNTYVAFTLVAPPGSNTASTGATSQVSISAVAVGPSPTTARKIYRTVVNGSQLKLQQTIADNITTVGVQDATADGSLGANAPTSDTSGLVILAVTTTNGAVAAGATSVVLTSASGFLSSGGWAFLASTAIRYTGISGNTLTGIPPNGIGSVLTAIPTAQQVTTNRMLIGIPSSGLGSITAPALINDSVALYAQRDNTTSQTLVAAIEGLNAKGIASDGIYEVKITDASQVTQAALDALCDADLALYASSLGIITITFSSLDRKLYVGRPITVNLPSLGLSGTFVIQTVNVTFFDNGQLPIFVCTASSVRYSLQDLLKHLVMAA